MLSDHALVKEYDSLASLENKQSRASLSNLAGWIESYQVEIPVDRLSHNAADYLILKKKQ